MDQPTISVPSSGDDVRILRAQLQETTALTHWLEAELATLKQATGSVSFLPPGEAPIYQLPQPGTRRITKPRNGRRNNRKKTPRAHEEAEEAGDPAHAIEQRAAAGVLYPTVRGPPLKRLLTVPEAVFSYGISRSKFYQEVAAGRIPLRKCGRRTLVAADDMEAWAAGLAIVSRTAETHDK
jgi:hypothetical protein